MVFDISSVNVVINIPRYCEAAALGWRVVVEPDECSLLE